MSSLLRSFPNDENISFDKIPGFCLWGTLGLTAAYIQLVLMILCSLRPCFGEECRVCNSFMLVGIASIRFPSKLFLLGFLVSYTIHMFRLLLLPTFLVPTRHLLGWCWQPQAGCRQF